MAITLHGMLQPGTQAHQELTSAIYVAARETLEDQHGQRMWEGGDARIKAITVAVAAEIASKAVTRFLALDRDLPHMPEGTPEVRP